MSTNLLDLNKLFINGEWVQAESGETFNVYNPATAEVVSPVPNGGDKEARLAVDAAHEAFRTWSQATAYERSTYIKKWHDIILEHKEEVAQVLVDEQGKPMTEALGEVNYAVSFLAWYAEEAKRIYGETIPASAIDKRIIILKQPVGVVAAITPWNFPAAMITRKIAPALAAGCTVVIKPAEQTPLTAIKLAELAEKAGLPKGVINVVTGDAKKIGQAWLEDERVAKITFTGSTEVGKLLMRGAADTVKKVSLELGGHAPVIVFGDADLDKAVEGVIVSKFRNAGQTCVCANRIYVEKSIVPQFTAKLREEVAKIKVGAGNEPEANIGPLINEQAYEKVQAHIDDAVEKGASIELGGKRIAAYDKGFFFEPTILSGVREDMVIMQEETFGPVAPIIEFDDVEDVIKKANSSRYGLAAYAYTENLKTAITVYEKLEFGIVGINDGLPSTAQAPFGGIKESGLGREGGHHGLDDFLEVKYVSIKL
ncbi:NAD-dependent succinate-semialdehyde dehydrogenase [Peribacillus saganii]|uniref:Aldehyde dehydrogenase n=1 Tax=Peribacillus saganii TaxID=2303992 RepID=A0A372LE84_9BACI|nr:NAD-dependent succinate-semialdehyde dehydrogenase [Peribacillus saganii]RFU64562.1 NAD-dependent succinate-semialdehyde dehydrogenase [Peribacillus saganii]